MAIKHEGYRYWEHHWTLKERKKSSMTRLIIHQVKKETSARWGHARSSRLSNGNLIGRLTNLERKKVFHHELELMENDGRSLDDLKVK